jgi:formyltetrahydrofolate deformylase
MRILRAVPRPNAFGDQHPPQLPAAFASRSYQRQRGVKLIEATAHYVTEELDAGPIIERDVAELP